MFRLALLLFSLSFALFALAEPSSALKVGTLSEDFNYTVRSISIDNQNVFDLTDPLENRGAYRLINSLHIKSRRSTILKQILFKVGSRFDANKIAESERILRSNNFIRDAQITYTIDAPYVDVYIKTADTWSTKPTIAFSQKGNSTKTKVALIEDNLLGSGVHSSIEYLDDSERTSTIFTLSTKNILSTRYEMGFLYANSSDGDQKSIAIARPFVGLDSTHAQGFMWDELNQANNLYDRNGKIYSYNMFKRELDVYKGWSAGLVKGRTIQHKIGFHSSAETFERNPDFSLDIGRIDLSFSDNYPYSLYALPDDQADHYPYYAVEYIENNYITTKNFKRIGRTEDRHVGIQGRFAIGYASESLGSEGNSFKFDMDIGKSYLLKPKLSFDLNLHSNFDVQEDTLHNIQTAFSSNLYLQQSHNWQTYLDYSYQMMNKMEYRKQLFLDATTGLRGYPEHFLSGNESHKITVEQRYFSDLNIFRIFNVGAALFYDIGKTTGDTDLDRNPSKVYSDLGLGLRIANNRSSFGRILHLDLAFPTCGNCNIDSYQISLSTKTSF